MKRALLEWANRITTFAGECTGPSLLALCYRIYNRASRSKLITWAKVKRAVGTFVLVPYIKIIGKLLDRTSQGSDFGRYEARCDILPTAIDCPKMARLIFTILAVCLVQISLARVVRDAPAQSEENSFFKTLTTIQEKAHDALTGLNQSVLKSLGFQSNDEVVETIQKNTKTYVEQLKTVQTSLEEELKKHSGVFDPIVKQLNDKIDETRKSLAEKNPDLVNRAQEYQENVQTRIQSLLTEAQKTGEQLKESSRGATEQLQTALKQLYDATVNTLQKTVKELEPSKPDQDQP
ncbi:apolipophorin-3-like [Armigeres subalbatus]|uniref:apolipophorin-3-like n=1 Tax=Armigeres subalbatus TaxID=124917 RepID=UPI002ED2253F